MVDKTKDACAIVRLQENGHATTKKDLPETLNMAVEMRYYNVQCKSRPFSKWVVLEYKAF